MRAPIVAFIVVLFVIGCADPSEPVLPRTVQPPPAITGKVSWGNLSISGAVVMITSGDAYAKADGVTLTDESGAFQFTGWIPGRDYVITAVTNRYACADVAITAPVVGGLSTTMSCRLKSSLTRDGIYVTDTLGTAIKYITFGRQPAWSPDASRIAFERNLHILVSNADGTGEQDLGVEGTRPAWSPDGQRIVFTDATAIFTVKIDGTDLRRLIKVDSTQWLDHPVWAPTGHRIAFVRAFVTPGPDGPTSETKVWVMSDDGSNLQALSHSGEPCSPGELGPAWSPDGENLALSTRCQGIFSAGAAGPLGAVQTLISNTGLRHASDPSWSPDARRIVAVVDWWLNSGPAPSLYIEAKKFGLARLLVDEAYEPAWSPDGSRVAFVHR